DLVEIALDDLVDELAYALQELRPRPLVEIDEAGGQRRHGVDEAAPRMAARRKEARVVEGDAQHRQLQASDFARHLRRHARIGEDLVEQAADDVDHHVIELAGRGLDELLAVGPNQVHRHQAGEAVVVLRPRGAGAAPGDGNAARGIGGEAAPAGTCAWIEAGGEAASRIAAAAAEAG